MDFKKRKIITLKLLLAFAKKNTLIELSLPRFVKKRVIEINQKIKELEKFARLQVELENRYNFGSF